MCCLLAFESLFAQYDITALSCIAPNALFQILSQTAAGYQSESPSKTKRVEVAMQYQYRFPKGTQQWGNVWF